jgi:hypothetical protein
VGSVFVENGLDADASCPGRRVGEPTESLGVQGARSDHVHSHPPWTVGIGELTNEVGQGRVGDPCTAGLRRGFGAEVATDGDDPGAFHEPVVNGADETQQSAELQRHGLAENAWLDSGEWSGGRDRGRLDHHPDGPGHRGGDRLSRRVIADVRGTDCDAVVDCAQPLEAVAVAGYGNNRHPGLAQAADD